MPFWQAGQSERLASALANCDLEMTFFFVLPTCVSWPPVSDLTRGNASEALDDGFHGLMNNDLSPPKLESSKEAARGLDLMSFYRHDAQI